MTTTDIQSLPHYDPDALDRVYYRRAKDGQLGWYVRREGGDCIKLDRNAQDVIVPYRPREWIEETDRRPLTVPQLAQMALAADCQLCRVLGMHEESRREWLSMKDGERRDWISEGPTDRKERADLWADIMTGRMKEHSR